MRWYFKRQSYANDIYAYSYSFESKEYDGLIVFNKKTNKIEVLKPSSLNADEYGIIRTKRHFYTIIEEGFPDERAVITG